MGSGAAENRRGALYHRVDMTDAHKNLSFGSSVRVLNLRNGRAVAVRTSNRGPHVKGRVIDLSLIAAKMVGVIKSEGVPIMVEVLAN